MERDYCSSGNFKLQQTQPLRNGFTRVRRNSKTFEMPDQSQKQFSSYSDSSSISSPDSCQDA